MSEKTSLAVSNVNLGRDGGAQDRARNYEVGYGKPPKSGQFKPGQSGNPRGRKKGDKSLKTTLSTAMRERITVHTGKGSKKLTKMEALVQRITNGALSGDAAATRQLLNMLQMTGLQSGLSEALGPGAVSHMMEEDRAILERHLPMQSAYPQAVPSQASDSDGQEAESYRDASVDASNPQV